MFIAIVDIQVAPENREDAVSVLQVDAEGARRLPGNLSFGAFADVSSPSAIRIFHEWDSQAAFAGYEQSELFAELGQRLRPLLIAPPLSRRLTAEPFATHCG